MKWHDLSRLADRSYPSFARRALFAIVALLFASLLFSALVHRPMAHEGAWWYYDFLARLRPMYDTSYWRQSDVLFQLPALLWLKIAPSKISVAIFLLDLCYGLHPALSLLATLFILKQRQRLDLAFFALLAFATSTLSTIGFALGIVPGALSAFWPLFFLVLLRREGSIIDALAILSLSIFLGFSHESAWLFFPVLAATSLWRRLALGARTYGELAVTLLALGFLGWYAYRFAFIWSHPDHGSFPPNPVGGVWDGLRQSLAGSRGFGYRITAWLLASVAALTFFPKHQRKLRLLMAIGCIDSFCFFLMTHGSVADPLFYSKLSRTSAIPVAALIAAAACLLSKPLKKLNWQETPFFKAAQGWLAVALLVCGFSDFCATLTWLNATDSLRALMRKEACQAFPDRNEFLTYNYAIRHYTSILLQETWKPQSIVFFLSLPPSPFPMYDTCRSHSYKSLFGDAFIQGGTGQPFVLAPWRFDYSELIPKLPPFYGKTTARPQQASPSSFPGLSLWLKADDLKGVKPGAPVASWRDSSGASNVVLTQNETALAPVYALDKNLAKPVLRFEKQGQLLEARSLKGERVFSGDQNTVFLVVKPVQDSPQSWLSWGDCQFNRFAIDLTGLTAAKLVFTQGPNGGGSVEAYVPTNWERNPTSDFHILSLERDQNQSYAFLDGIRVSPLHLTSTKLETSAVSSLKLGGGCSKNTFLGEIAELIVFKAALPRDALLKVEGYLSAKYRVRLYE